LEGLAWGLLISYLWLASSASFEASRRRGGCRIWEQDGLVDRGIDTWTWLDIVTTEGARYSLEPRLVGLEARYFTFTHKRWHCDLSIPLSTLSTVCIQLIRLPELLLI
jgi:hypothetical protein